MIELCVQDMDKEWHCAYCGRYALRDATPEERKQALTDEELEAEVRRRCGDPKSSLYSKSMWVEAFKFEEGRLRDLEADDEQPAR